MVELSGRYYDGKRTLSSPARLRRTYDGLILETDNLPPRPVSVAKVVQLATTLSITFKEGGKIELPPDTPLRRLGLAPLRKSKKWPHDERPMLTLITVFLFALLFGAWLWGIPASAWLAAHLTPSTLSQEMDERALAALDQTFLTPSKIDEKKREELTQAFTRVAATAKLNNTPPRLIFRQAHSAPRSSFGLPGGTIIMTDSLVEAAVTNGEIMGVFAHELALMEQQEPLRRFFASIGWAAIGFILTRDHGSVLDCAEAEANIILHVSYTPATRAEADFRAMDMLQAIGENPSALADLYERISKIDDLVGLPLVDDERRAVVRAYAASRKTTP